MAAFTSTTSAQARVATADQYALVVRTDKTVNGNFQRGALLVYRTPKGMAPSFGAPPDQEIADPEAAVRFIGEAMKGDCDVIQYGSRARIQTDPRTRKPMAILNEFTGQYEPVVQQGTLAAAEVYTHADGSQWVITARAAMCLALHKAGKPIFKGYGQLNQVQASQQAAAPTTEAPFDS
jgi:hypothetical protein